MGYVDAVDFHPSSKTSHVGEKVDDNVIDAHLSQDLLKTAVGVLDLQGGPDGDLKGRRETADGLTAR